MTKKKVKTLVRIFEDGSAEILENESLDNFLTQEAAALSLLLTHSRFNPKKGDIEWLPIIEARIKK